MTPSGQHADLLDRALSLPRTWPCALLPRGTQHHRLVPALLPGRRGSSAPRRARLRGQLHLLLCAPRRRCLLPSSFAHPKGAACTCAQVAILVLTHAQNTGTSASFSSTSHFLSPATFFPFHPTSSVFRHHARLLHQSREADLDGRWEDTCTCTLCLSPGAVSLTFHRTQKLQPKVRNQPSQAFRPLMERRAICPCPAFVTEHPTVQASSIRYCHARLLRKTVTRRLSRYIHTRSLICVLI